MAQFGQRKAWPVLDAKMVSAGKAEDTEEEGSDSDDHFAGRPRSPEVSMPCWGDTHPPFIPKTLTKFGLRTAGFNLTPKVRNPEAKQTNDEKKETRLFHLLQSHDEERLRRQSHTSQGLRGHHSHPPIPGSIHTASGRPASQQGVRRGKSREPRGSPRRRGSGLPPQHGMLPYGGHSPHPPSNAKPAGSRGPRV